MAVTGLQRVTVAAALVLCAALILPKTLLRRDPPEETAPGRFPPIMHRHVTPEPRGQRSAGVRGHGEVKGTGSGGAGTGTGLGGKSNLAAQIIPVYGFGILLYILYILFKITSKGSSKPSQSRFQSLRSENNKRKITDYELCQLQERLRETEEVMETIVNKTLHSPASVSSDQEQSLLQQLTAITSAMKTNHLLRDLNQDLDQDLDRDLNPDLDQDLNPDLDQDQVYSQDHTQDYSSERPDWENWDRSESSTFWSHPHCSCSQTHEEEQRLEDQQTHKEEQRMEDQQTHEEEQALEDQQTHEEEQALEDQQTHEEEHTLEDQQTHEEEGVLEDCKAAVEEERRTVEDQQTPADDRDETVEEEQTLEDQQTDVHAAEEEEPKMEFIQKTSNVRRRNKRRRGRRE